MGKFLIEGNFYIVPDEYSYNIAKPIGTDKRNGKTVFENIAFCSTPEEALKYYAKIKGLETACKAPDGTIKDLIDKLTATTENLTKMLSKIAALYDPENLRP